MDERGRRPALSRLERMLGLVTDVRAGEGAGGLVLLSGLFLLVAANYFLKPARDGLLASEGIVGISDMELKAYSSFGQSLLLLFVVPLYASLSRRLGRQALIGRVTAFSAATLVLFWMLRPRGGLGPLPGLGIVFYLWVGIFNVFVVAQFWAFAADLYNTERGRRLFPLIGVGATAGAVAGSWLVRMLLASGLSDTYGLLLAGAGLVAASIPLLRRAEKLESAAPPAPIAPSAGTLGESLRLLLSNRYLWSIAAIFLLVNWVKTNSDSLLFAVVQEVIRDEAAARSMGEAFMRDGTTSFYAGFFFWVGAASFVLQAFVSSRVLERLGLGPLLLILPLFALAGYSMLAMIPVLGLFRITKIGEDALNYSLHNTAANVLWLPTTPALKYRAKLAIETLVVRMGDGLAALTALVGVQVLDLAPRSFFIWNAILVAIWVGFALVVVDENRRLTRRAETLATSPKVRG